MAIWVIKDGQREGPYQEQDVRELVYEGTYNDSDPAIRDGQFDWSTLGQVLGRQPSVADIPLPSPEQPATPPALAPEPPPFPVTPSVESPPSPTAETPIPPELPSLAPQLAPPSRPVQVAVVDFEMPFGSMVILMVKWVLAAIPALFILAAIAAIFWTLFFAVIASAFHR